MTRSQREWLGQQGQHVIKEPYSRVDLSLARAVQVQLQVYVRLSGLSVYRGGSWHVGFGLRGFGARERCLVRFALRILVIQTGDLRTEISQQRQQRVDLLIRPNGDPQAVSPVRIVHVSDQDPLSFELFVNRLCRSLRMCAPDKVGLGIRNGKT